jgi:hypothetical protein
VEALDPNVNIYVGVNYNHTITDPNVNETDYVDQPLQKLSKDNLTSTVSIVEGQTTLLMTVNNSFTLEAVEYSVKVNRGGPGLFAFSVADAQAIGRVAGAIIASGVASSVAISTAAGGGPAASAASGGAGALVSRVQFVAQTSDTEEETSESYAGFAETFEWSMLRIPFLEGDGITIGNNTTGAWEFKMAVFFLLFSLFSSFSVTITKLQKAKPGALYHVPPSLSDKKEMVSTLDSQLNTLRKKIAKKAEAKAQASGSASGVGSGRGTDYEGELTMIELRRSDFVQQILTEERRLEFKASGGYLG